MFVTCVALGQSQPKPLYGAFALKYVIGQVFSRDTAITPPDIDEDDDRSYISAVSEVITDDSQRHSQEGQLNGLPWIPW